MQQVSRGGLGQYRDYDALPYYGRGLGESSGTDGARGRGRGRGYRPRGGLGYTEGRYKKSYSDEVRDQVDELFSKKFKFQDEYDQWRLPESSAVFREESFKIPELTDLKKRLNFTKSKLDNKDMLSWHRHTNFTNRAGEITFMLRKEFQPEMCTQAWAKIHEILWTFNIIPQNANKLNSVHLCEAPGAFIASLNHYLKTHRMDCTWQWRAMTLNPYFEENNLVDMIDQDKFMSETWEQWYHGVDNSGDVTIWENVEGLREVVRREMGEVHLVTADGGINCADNPGEQEEISAKLLFCEVVISLLLLKSNGTLVLKTFTTLEHKTICLLYLLACCFAELHVFKPATSKAGNSEQYLICLGYKGANILSQKLVAKLKLFFGPHPPPRAVFPSSSIPPSFLTQLTKCAFKFAKYQMDMIEENVKLYDCMKRSEKQFIVEVKELACDTFKNRFKVKNLPREKAVVQQFLMNGTQLNVVQPVQLDPASQWMHRRTADSFLSRMEQRKKTWAVRVVEGEEGEPPAAKQPRTAQSEGSTHAVQHVLNAIGYESSKSAGGKPGDQGPVAMEMEPEDVQWLKRVAVKTTGHDLNNDLKSLDGRKITKVTNSRFCRPESLKKLTEALDNAQIMQPAQSDEHTHIASHVTPGHALTSSHPPFFLNSEALNFAALDYLTDFIAKAESGANQPLTFVDLAGAPSGFSHYVYWKKQHLAKGWGMVRVEHPLLGPGRLMEQVAPWETFQVLGPHSGVDICDSNSIKSLCAGVENYCSGGVQLVIGDVPPAPFGAHSLGAAECHVKQHFLAQCICVCKILHQGGVFVCRLYDLLTRFSAGLLFLMYHLFEEVAIVKPLTSSPTSSERFLVCRGFQGCRSILTEMLLAVNGRIASLRKEGVKQDVLEVVPMQLLFEEQFYRYLTLNNERIVQQRTRAVISLERYFLHPERLPNPEDQELLREGTLEILQLPANPYSLQ